MKLVAQLCAATFFLGLSAAAFGDVILHPGESEFIGGHRVMCVGNGGGHGGGGHGDRVVRRSFRCVSSNPSYPALDSQLRVTSTTQNGDSQVKNLFNFHFKNGCEAIANGLNRACGNGRGCSYHFCEANNSSYSALDSTLYGVRTEQRGGGMKVSAKETFGYMNECKAALGSYPNG